MNVRLVYVSADYKGMIAFSKTLCKFYAQPVCFFLGNLTRAEGLAHMIGNHIIRATHSSGRGYSWAFSNSSPRLPLLITPSIMP